MKSIVIIELDLESAMVDLESTQVRIRPGFSAIFSFFDVFLVVFCVLGDQGGLEKKVINEVDRARLARSGIGND